MEAKEKILIDEVIEGMKEGGGSVVDVGKDEAVMQ